MPPDPSSPNPAVRPSPGNGRGLGRRRRPHPAPTALEALSTASRRYTRGTAGERTTSHRYPWVLPVVAALVVAAVLALAVPFEHLCAATLRYTGEQPDTHVPRFRAELLDFAWNQDHDPTLEQPHTPQWYVEAPADRMLRLCLVSPNRHRGVAHVRSVAHGFLARAEARQADVRALPTEGEHVLSRYAAQLETRLNEAQAQLEASLASLPDDNPQQHRDRLLSRWQGLRTRFETTREELAEASTRLHRLENEPEPTHGIVPTQTRRAALDADLGLQQDLRELHVFLTELKVALLDVWRKSHEALEHLTATTEQLTQGVFGENAPDPRTQRQIHDLATEADLYRQTLSAFTLVWAKDLEALEQVVIDPLSEGLLNIHQRARTRLNDFLFEAAKRLTTMRNIVQTIGENTGDQARYHVLQSNLMRSFRLLQSAHHRFEFTAGNLDARDNFRLDSALRGARGLRRRSQQRIRVIDERLQKEATQHAREQRIRDLAVARRDVRQLRDAADETVTELVSLQEELNLNAGLTQDFLQAVVHSEIVKQRVETTQADLTDARDQLAELAARRTGADSDLDLELVECGVIAPMINLPQRLRTAALAAVATFLVVALGQWIRTRRATPHHP